MKTNYKYFPLLLFAVLPVCTAFAQQIQADTSTNLSLSLPQVWEYAERNNRNIQMKQLQMESSIEEIKDARAEKLPEIEVDGEYAKITNMPVYVNGLFKTPDQFHVLHTTYTVGTNVYFNLFDGNKTNLKIRAGESESKIAAEQKKLTTSEVKLRAAMYYLDMQRSKVFKDLLLKDIASQEKQLLEIRALLKNGVVLKSDVLRAELKLSRQKLSLVQLDNDVAIANQKLNILIGLPDEQRITADQEVNVDTILVKPYTDYLTDASINSYQIKISEQETELRKIQLRLTKANALPKIGLFGTYKYSYPQIFLYPYEAAIYGIGLGGIKASYSISSIYHNKHKTNAAVLNYKSQEIEHKYTEDLIRQQVKEAYLRYKEALNRVEVTKTNIIQATENLRIVNNTYFNQLSLVTDLLDADTQMLQTRFDLAAAQIAAQLQYYQLQSVTGQL